MKTELKKESLDRIIKMLTHAVSYDDTRDRLGNVRIAIENPISPEPKHVRISATDGFMLSEVVLQDKALVMAAQGKPCYIHRDQLDYLKLMLKQTPKWASTLPNVDVVGEILNIDCKPVSTKDVQFPDLTEIRPKFEPDFEVGLNCELLLDLCKSLNGSKTQIVKLSFKTSEKMNPIKVSASGNRGVLMPCRV